MCGCGCGQKSVPAGGRVPDIYALHGDDEPHMAEIFFGSFSFPGIKMPEREQELLGMKLGYEVDGRKVLMLLGRDFLDGCTLTYDGPQQMFELRW